MGNSPATNITDEVRYAVVMYGGVSLCIYINGVAQELLEMAKATAPAGRSVAVAQEELSPSARLYRRLGQYLDSDSMDPALLFEDNENAPVRTRFVVDVLSGTSAGGLNAIFLAKALVNNKDMEGLRELWMTEGDIQRLLNDRKSSLPKLPAKRQPDSLLNSQRMYAKLLEALHVMDFTGDTNFERPNEKEPAPPNDVALVEELDLYVTATDLSGFPIHLKLDNTVAHELRHKNVFNFRFRRDANNFTWEFNPLLAFAGRCTSSIPPAFEPMRLADICDVLRLRKPYRALADEGSPKWHPVYSEYLRKNETGDFWQRDFGDGGFLDNKPFTYATHALMRRQAERPVRRKLIYIEPSPEDPLLDPTVVRAKPDAIAHSLAALVELPRYETIREDLDAVLDRNHLLARIDELTRQVDRDVDTFKRKVIKRVTGEDFESIPLKTLIQDYGIAYGSYHRLKVAEVTSDLATLVSQLLDYPPESDEHLAIRILVESWRKTFYAEDPSDPKKFTESKFLMNFDPTYRFRRLFFLHRKINFFYRFAPGSAQALERAELLKQSFPDPLPKEIAKLLDSPDVKRWARFREGLLEIKPKLANVLAELRRACYDLRRDPKIKALLQKLNLQRTDLLKSFSDESSARELGSQGPRFIEISDYLSQTYENAFRAAAGRCEELFAKQGAAPEAEIVQQVLKDIYDHFDHYDMAIFPMQYGTNSYETPHIDVVRISPRDARSVNDDNDVDRPKLAGRKFFSFGAFCEKSWRENDMLFGRLDGSEILVRDLLRNTGAATEKALNHPALQKRNLQPGDNRSLADVFIDDLHTAILSGTVTCKRRNDVWDMLHKGLPKLGPPKWDKELSDFFNDSSGLEEAMRSIKEFCKDDAALLAYYKKDYRVNLQLEPKVLLRLFARGTQIFGKMLEKIGTERGKNGKQMPTAFVARAAAIFSGLVEVSVPRTPWAILWRYWRALLYIIGALLVLVGLIFGKGAVQTNGFLVLALTGAFHIATIWLQLFIGRSKYLKFLSATAVSLVIVVFLMLGLWKAFELSRSFFQDRQESTVRATNSPK